MLAKTKFFGDIEINEKDIIRFIFGMPGFSNLKEYVIIENEGDTPFIYLQSLDEAAVCFIITLPVFIDKNYDIEISSETVEKLEIEKPEDVDIYVILAVSENIKNTTANLKAPIIINKNNNKALQEILENSEYSIRHKAFAEEGDSSC